MPNRRKGKGRKPKQPKSKQSLAAVKARTHVHAQLPNLVVARIPPSVQLFPDELENWGLTQVQLTLSAVAGVTFTFKLNGSFNLFGPQINNAGAFATNVPAGSNYLLSTNSAAGSNAPYFRATSRKAMVDLEVLGVSSNTIPISVATFPSVDSSISGLAIAICREQKGAAYGEISYNATSPLKLSTAVNFSTLFGVSDKEILDSPDYSQLPGVDPANLCYYHIYIASMDGTTAQTCYVNMSVRHLFRFRGLNTFNSTAPS